MTNEKQISSLPTSFTNVQPVVLSKKDLVVPLVHGPACPAILPSNTSSVKQRAWLENVRKVLDKPDLSESDAVSWAAFHANLQTSGLYPGTVALMPLFIESAHTPAMIKHAMDVVRAATQAVNPGQVPVLAMDQPLFALGKMIQWAFPDSHGESKFVLMLGAMHTEMSFFKVLGDLLADDGWTTVISPAGVATGGVADSLLKAAHLTRTRHTHTVTAATLYLLQCQAYESYKQSISSDEDIVDFHEWVKKMCAERPQFQFWNLVLELEMDILQYVQSLREGDFKQYIESLVRLTPWEFSTDHTNYARWLPIHIRDMSGL